MMESKIKLEGKRVVIVQCGSFNPPHYLHLRLLEMARDYLRENGAEVIGGIISPVADSYGKKGLLSASHRIEMCKLAVSDSRWVSVDTWESSLSSYTTTKKVLDHIAETFSHNKSTVADPMLVCGADLLDSFNTPGVWDPLEMQFILGQRGIICIEREGTDTKKLINDSPILSPFANNIFLVPPTVSNNVSSTAIRQCAKLGRSLRYLLPDSVIAYINTNKIYQENS